MKRNFKIIKHDKTLSNLSDADINKLYNTYIEMDGKHQNFKGSKREYCSTVAGMIKEWLKEVVDKNGGISNKSLSGGKGTRLASRALYKSKNDELKKIQQEIEKLKTPIVDKKTSKVVKKTPIEDLTKKKEELRKKIEDVEKLLDGADLNEEGLPLLKSVNDTIVTNKENIKKIYNPDTKAALAFKDSKRSLKRLTLEEAQKDCDEELQVMIGEKKKLLEDPDYKKNITPTIKKLKALYSEKISKLEEELAAIETSDLKVKEDEELRVKEAEEAEEKRVKRIKELETIKQSLEEEKERIKKKEDEHEDEKGKKFIETIKKVTNLTGPEVRGRTPTTVVKNIETGDKYTLQELHDEAFKYRHVIKFFLNTDTYPTGTSEDHGTYVVRRFLKALPFKKILEISEEGYKQRVEFIAKYGLKDGYGNPILWSETVEESFRSESFVFWKLLAKNIKEKYEVVNNFELLGKIFSHVLYFATVDFRLKYFTGDSKGVKTTSTIVTRYGRDPVVGLAKILSVLNESASYDASGNITTFNNPRIIFTFYRDSRTPDGKSLMLKYTQDKDKFTGKLPYELLLDYDLKKLLSSSRGSEITEMLQNAKRDGTTLQSEDNLEKLREIVKELYNTGTTRNPNLFPVTDEDGVEKRYELSLAMSNNPKIRKDLNIVGYSKDIFVGKPPTIQNYVNNYRQSDDTEIVSAIRNFDGSDIKDFVFKSLVGDSAVVTEVDIGDDDDDDETASTSTTVRATPTVTATPTVPATPTAPVNTSTTLKDLYENLSLKDINAQIKHWEQMEYNRTFADDAKVHLELLRGLRTQKGTKPTKKTTAKKSKSATTDSPETKSVPIEDTKPLTKLTEEEKAALKKSEEEAEGSDDEAAKKGKLIARGKPKSYIKKIIKYYQ